MKKVIRFVIACMISVIWFTGCENRDQNSVSREVISEVSGIVSVDGSTSMEKVINSLGEAFTNQHTDIKFTYNPTGSGSGIVATADRRCDIGLTSRYLKHNEISYGLTQTVIARDGIALIVNTENAVENLTTQQIADIYTGKLTDWEDLGAKKGDIVVVGREAGSGTRDGFETITNTKDNCRYRLELTSAGDVITAVMQNPNAIGYVSIASVKSTVKQIRVDGVEATSQSVTSGEYAIQRPFILVTRSDEKLSPAAQEFFDYVISKEAAPIISHAGAFPVK